MKIKKAINLCKQRGAIYLFDGSDKQWIGDGCAMYPMDGMPIFDEETLYKTYDLSPKKVAYFHEDLPETICFDDCADGESRVEPLSIRIQHAGRSLIPILVSQGVAFMDEKYMAPISDEDKDTVAIYERYSVGGTMYFAVKVGLILYAVVIPIDVVKDNLVADLETLAHRSRVALINKKGE